MVLALATGWETFNGGDIILNDTNSTATRVSFDRLVLPATLDDNPILFVLGNSYVVIAFVMLVFALREISLNRAAKKGE